MLKELRKLFNTDYKMSDRRRQSWTSGISYTFRFPLSEDKIIDLNVMVDEPFMNEMIFWPDYIWMFEDHGTRIKINFIEKLYLFFKIRRELKLKKRFKKESARQRLTSFINENIQSPTVTASPEKVGKPILSIIKDPRKLFS